MTKPGRLPLLIVPLLLLLAGCQLEPVRISGVAIVFGASDYPGTANDLLGTRKDAEAMAELLDTQGWTVYLLFDEDATKQDLESQLAKLDAHTRLNSPVLFFYAGHGTWYQDKGLYYLVPVNALDGSGTLNNFISQNDIFELLAKHDIRHPILILDSCNSGGFAMADGSFDAIQEDYNPWATIKPEPAFSHITDLATGAFLSFNQYKGTTQAVVLAAAGPPELSWESSQFTGHGVFTWFILQAAKDKKADTNRDGYISTTEVYLYVTTQLNLQWNLPNSYDADRVYLPRHNGQMREYQLFKLP